MVPSPTPIIVTLAGVALWLLCLAYMSAQRSLLTGQCQHWRCGKRAVVLTTILLTGVTGAAVLLLVYETQRSGLLGPASEASMKSTCTAMMFLSYVVPGLFVQPYIFRGFRMVVLFETSLRQRFSWAAKESNLTIVLVSFAALMVAIFSLAVVLDPSSLQNTRCFFGQEIFVFVSVPMVSLLLVAFVLRLFVIHKPKDQYGILKELIDSVVQSMPFFVSYAVYANMALRDPTPSLLAAEDVFPPHLLLLLLLIVALMISLVQPFCCDPTSLARTPRLAALTAHAAAVSLGATTLARAVQVPSLAASVTAEGRSLMGHGATPSPSPSSTPSTSPLPLASRTWKGLLGAGGEGVAHSMVSVSAPLFVPLTPCSPGDPVAWWCWFACHCHQCCAPCCLGMHREGAASTSAVFRSAGRPMGACSGHDSCAACCGGVLSPCCGGGRPAAVYEVPALVDDAPGTAPAALTSTCPAPCSAFCRRTWGDPAAYATQAVVWGAVLGASPYAPFSLLCCRPAPVMASEEAGGPFCVLAGAAPVTHCVAVTPQGRLTALPGAGPPLSPDQATASIAALLAVLGPVQQDILAAACAAAHHTSILLESASSDGPSDEQDGDGAGVLDASHQAGIIMSILGRILCVTPRQAQDSDRAAPSTPAVRVSIATRQLSIAEQARVGRSNPAVLAQVWSLPKLIMHPQALTLMRAHSKSCLCPELVDFMVLVREYKRQLYLAICALQAGHAAHHPAGEAAPLRPAPALQQWLGLPGADMTLPAGATAPVQARSKLTAHGVAHTRAVFCTGLSMFQDVFRPARVKAQAGGGSASSYTSKGSKEGGSQASLLFNRSISGSSGSSAFRNALQAVQDAIEQDVQVPHMLTTHDGTPALDCAAVVTAINHLMGLFIIPGSPLQVNVSSAMRTRVLDDAAALVGHGHAWGSMAHAPPPLPSAKAPRARREAWSVAPAPSPSGCFADIPMGSGRAQGEADAAMRAACIFDEVLRETAQLVELNVCVSLYGSNLGRRLALLRFCARRGRGLMVSSALDWGAAAV